MLKELHTDRLLLRQWRESDFKYFENFFSSEANAQYVGGKKNGEEAWRLLSTYIGHWQLKGYSYMAVEEKATGTFVGCAGLWKSEPWPELELGYWFVKEMQGKGYATEAAQKIKEYAFDTLKVPTLVSYIDAKNKPSIKLAERIGGVYDKTIVLLDFGPHCIYRYND